MRTLTKSENSSTYLGVISIQRIKVCTEEFKVAVITVYFFIPHIL